MLDLLIRDAMLLDGLGSPPAHGSVGVKEHHLNVWIGDDNIPLAAEQVQEATPRVLFFHGSMMFRESWLFTHVTDHLVIIRSDSSHTFDMLGQKSSGESSEVLTLRQQ